MRNDLSVSGRPSVMRVDITADRQDAVEAFTVAVGGSASAGQVVSHTFDSSTDGGSGYGIKQADDTYTLSGYDTVRATTGSGKGLFVRILSINSSGTILDIELITLGSLGYAGSETCTIDGGNGDATFTISVAVGTKHVRPIVSRDLYNSATNQILPYSLIPKDNITNTKGGTNDRYGVGFEFDLKLDKDGFVTGILLRQGGYGYLVDNQIELGQSFFANDHNDITLTVTKTVPATLDIYSQVLGGHVQVLTGDTLKLYTTPCSFRSENVSFDVYYGGLNNTVKYDLQNSEERYVASDFDGSSALTIDRDLTLPPGYRIFMSFRLKYHTS